MGMLNTFGFDSIIGVDFFRLRGGLMSRFRIRGAFIRNT